MKKNRIITLLILSFGLWASCSKNKLNEIDTDPNNPAEVTPDLLLAQVEANTAFAIAGADLAWYASVFVEHTTGVHGQLQDAERRQGINTSIGTNSWQALYTNLKDLKSLIDQGTAEEAWQHVAIAKILTAYNLGVATDMWGKVPYSQALQAPENFSPVFDNQQDVYTSIQTLLDDALLDLDKDAKINPQSDLMSGSWAKTAYSLKARFYNRLSKTSAYNAAALKAALDKSYLDGGSTGDGCYFTGFNASPTGANPWLQEEEDRGHHAISKTMFDLMDSVGDPRIPLFFTKVVIDDEGNEDYNPAPNGTALNDQGGGIYSRMTGEMFGQNDGVLTSSSPMPLVTYEEMLFIKAELEFREGGASAAKATYEEAVTAACTKAKVDGGDIATLLANPEVNPVAGPTLENIITQKWLSFWLFEPIEAYCDYRRTGFPTLNNPIGPAPRRIPYPQSELDTNPNAPNTPSNNGVWWDDLSDD